MPQWPTAPLGKGTDARGNRSVRVFESWLRPTFPNGIQPIAKPTGFAHNQTMMKTRLNGLRRSVWTGIAVVLGMASSIAIADESRSFTISGLEFKPGKAWVSKKPSSSMRAAELAIKPAPDADPLTAVFYYFGPGQGGSADANVRRWLSQFQGKPDSQETTEHKIGEATVKILHAKGTYLESRGGPFGPKTPRPDHAMLAAIVPGKDADVFVKLTGPESEVAKISKQFTALATSPFKSPDK